MSNFNLSKKDFDPKYTMSNRISSKQKLQEVNEPKNPFLRLKESLRRLLTELEYQIEFVRENFPMEYPTRDSFRDEQIRYLNRLNELLQTFHRSIYETVLTSEERLILLRIFDLIREKLNFCIILVFS